MTATEPSLTPPATSELDADARRSPSPRSRPRRRAAWCRSTRPTLPALDAKVAEYVDSIVDARRALARRSRPRPATSRSMGDDDIRAAADTSNRLLAVAGARDAAADR